MIPPAMIPPAIEDDPTCAELLAKLPQEWAQVPADSDGKEVALRFIRAAYGRGYVTALETEGSGR